MREYAVTTTCHAALGAFGIIAVPRQFLNTQFPGFGPVFVSYIQQPVKLFFIVSLVLTGEPPTLGILCRSATSSLARVA